jgi:uncharacterized membrane protein YccC
MDGLFHVSSLRYALALWLATVTALLITFVVQLEPAQWAGITVWIVFIQNPRMNYSKIIWWAFGTIVGAFMAVILTVCFNQMPEVLLFFLALWLAGCAAAATLVTNYRAYGVVLAGYTCAIVSMSAVDNPDLILRLAVTRVSCIFLGMTSAIFFIGLLLPKHGHWQETMGRLGDHFKATLLQAAKAINPEAIEPNAFTWRHLVDRLSTLEHTLDITTAETADSRIHAAQARSLAATLFNLLAKAQAIEIHLTRPGAFRPRPEIAALLIEVQTLVRVEANSIPSQSSDKRTLGAKIEQLQESLAGFQSAPNIEPAAHAVSNRFLLDRLDEILKEFAYAVQDWRGLFGDWTARREVHLAVHKDYLTAFIYGLRMFLAMGMVSALWFITQWPSGSQLVLFTAVVCSLLSLLDHAPTLGWPFLKSAVFCAIMAYVEEFWLFQRSDGFLILALMLGLFLLPAAYAYRHPRLIGDAVVSMLIFYGLTMPANQMNYDIIAFLNNGLALLGASACGFFAFHAVPSLDWSWRRFWLLHAVRTDIAHAKPVSDQIWTSRMFDRLRLLHRAASAGGESAEWVDAENEILVGLQLGLRQRRLRAQLKTTTPEIAAVVRDVLVKFQEIVGHPNIVALFLRSACLHLEEIAARKQSANTAGVLGEMWEMSFLLETSTRFASNDERN